MLALLHRQPSRTRPFATLVPHRLCLVASLAPSSVTDPTSRYEFETIHAPAKDFNMHIDVFMYGLEPLSVLLFWGDLKAMRTGAAKALDAHSNVLTLVRTGEAAADTCALPSVPGLHCHE